MRCALPCHLFPMFMLPCASVVYMKYAFDRLCFFDTLCVSFSFAFSIYCFVAAIYANKDVYIGLRRLLRAVYCRASSMLKPSTASVFCT